MTKKSTSKFVSSKENAVNCELSENIELFSDTRVEEYPMVISCVDAALRDICEGTTEPCLIVPSSDLNSGHFGKELGTILLKEKTHIFFGTSGLSKQGKERLDAIVGEAKVLFDNRLRIILYGNSCLEELAEKRFQK